MAARAKNIRALAGARAIPPLLLVLYHYCEGHSYRGLHVFDLFIAKSYLWVEFFFGLSGFILTYVYGSRGASFWQWKAYSGFLKARLARLYPLHIFMLLFILYLLITLRFLAHEGGYTSIYDQSYRPVLTFWSFIGNLFLVQAWNLFHSLTWNGVAWFVSIEFLLCLLFPIYITISRGGVLAGMLLIVAGFGGLLALIFTNTHGLDITFHNGALRGMSDFAIGVGMATVYGRIRARDGEPLPDYVHTIIQLIVVAALFYAIYHSGWSHQWRDIYLVPPMMALIFVLAFDRGWVASFFQSTPLQKLGEWSYAIYLGQTAWLQLIRFIQQRFYPPDDTIVMGYRWPDFIWWLEPISLVIVCLIWGALLSTFVEEPASKILRRWLDRAPKTRIGALDSSAASAINPDRRNPPI